MIVVILGSDRALAGRALKRALQSVDPGGVSTDRIDAAAASSEAIVAAVTAAPFFGSQRVVVLTGLLSAAGSGTGRGSKAKSGNDIARLIDSVPSTTTLILFEPDAGQLSAPVQKLLTPARVTISTNDAPRGGALVDMARRLAEEQDSRLDADTARYLLGRLFPGSWEQAAQNRYFDKPPSVELLESEISKLALSAYPNPISRREIDDLVPPRAEERLFPLLDAIISGNQKRAIIESEGALRAGEDPGRTLSQLYQQIELTVGSMASGRPPDPQQTARALGVTSAYRVSKAADAGQRSVVPPPHQLRLALDTDRRLKTGRIRNPDEALVDLAIQATQSNQNR